MASSQILSLAVGDTDVEFKVRRPRCLLDIDTEGKEVEYVLIHLATSMRTLRKRIGEEVKSLEDLLLAQVKEYALEFMKTRQSTKVLEYGTVTTGLLQSIFGTRTFLFCFRTP